MATLLSPTMALLAVALAAADRSANRAADGETDADLSRLVACMSGSFASTKQSQTDLAYFDIRLEMAPIWADSAKPGEHWFYVEQARADALDSPYRQRVYRVTRRADGKLVSAVFLLPEGGKPYVGGFKNAALLAGLTPDKLEAREGCDIELTANADSTFTGGTTGHECASNLRGATYATSEVTISEHQLRSWDRGFDASGKQVWGATKGPYVFDKAGHSPAGPATHPQPKR